MAYSMHNMTSKTENSINSLPSGWKRQETRFANGLSTGKFQVKYISPDGEIIYNKAQLIKKLGPNFDFTNFNFQTGKHMQVSKKFQARSQRFKDSQDALKPAVACRPIAIEMLKRQRCAVVKNFPKNQSRKINGANSIKSAPLQILQDKRFEPYSKNIKFRNFLTNTELENLLKKQKNNFDREEVMGLLSQRYNHPQMKYLGPLPTNKIVEVTSCSATTKNSSFLSLMDFTDTDVKNQKALINRLRFQLSEAHC